MTTANDLTRAVLLTLQQRFPDARCWRRNVGGGYPAASVRHALALLAKGHVAEAIAVLRRSRVVHFGMAGELDIDGIIRINGYGVRLAVEVKTDSDRMREEQVSFARMVREHGGIAVVARDVEQCMADLQAEIDKRTYKRTT